nr:MAG TPA: hypothetical protein [Caudoviricetes sp.]
MYSWYQTQKNRSQHQKSSPNEPGFNTIRSFWRTRSARRKYATFEEERA